MCSMKVNQVSVSRCCALCGQGHHMTSLAQWHLELQTVLGLEAIVTSKQTL